MVKQPLVSVVVPCYRQGHLLSATLESVLAQSFRDLEVVVVNDGSDDDTDAVAARYGDRIRYIRQENQGLPAARNTGIAAATGKYVHFLDSDDLLHPEAIGWLVESVAGREEALVVMGYRTFIDAESPTVDRPMINDASPGLRLLTTNLAPPHAYLSSRAAVLACGGFNVRLDSCEDWDLWLRLVFAGAELIPVQRIGAYYRQHPQSMSRNLGRMARANAQVLQSVRELLDRHPERVRQLGGEPSELRLRLTDLITQERLDAGYHFREQRMYREAIRQLALSIRQGRFTASVVAGAVKLFPHWLRQLIRGVSAPHR